jgi:glutamate carboxypeptidase
VTDYLALLKSDFEKYMRDLESLVNLDCGTHNKAGVDTVSTIIQERFREFGAEVTVFPQEQYGDCVYGRWHGKGTARIFLIGHMDTVYPDGTAAQHPLHREGSLLKGPGVSDMKSGLLSAVYAAHAVVQSGFENFAEIGVFCNSEEEVGSPISRDVYAPFARGANAALVLEGGRSNGNIVSSRKGVGRFTVTVRGRSAHAGVEPEKGANAIVALARYIEAIQALNGMRDGLTVNVGVVNGGTKANVVPDFAQAEVDIRIIRTEDGVALEKAIREIVAREMVKGTTAEVYGVIRATMEKTPHIAHLAELAMQAASELGFKTQDQATGGGSDGNYIAALGTPTLDGLGPVGGDDHNVLTEWLDYDSILPRTAMVAKLIVAVCEGK